MGSVTVGTPKHSVEDGKRRLSASIDLGTRVVELEYRVPGGIVAEGGEAFLAAALLPAMKLGGELVLASPVSPRLLAATEQIRDIYASWEPGLRSMPITAEPATPRPSGGEIACFFTGGVDSFYSVLKHKDEIDKLIFVHGFDLRLDATELRERVAAKIRAAAAELGKPLIEVETNFRELLDPFVSWNLAHGAALASVALVVAPQFRKIYIASSQNYADLLPLGSHPLLDPLWSTESLSLVHDGSETRRETKVARLAKSDIAMRYLRVCWENLDGKYNCGRCGKCLRTMVSLRLAGASDRCMTFDRPLDLKALAHMPMDFEANRRFTQRLLAATELRGDDPALAQALRAALQEQEAGHDRSARRKSLRIL